MHTVLLVIHIAAGSLGLLVGPAAMLAPKRPGSHHRFGLAYQGLVALLSLSALGLVVYRPAVWWLGVIAAATWGAALGGWWVRRRRFAGWLVWHINLMCGSYISFVTAFLVVNIGLGSVLAWTAPTVVGSPLIARATIRAVRPRRRTGTGTGAAESPRAADGDRPRGAGSRADAA